MSFTQDIHLIQRADQLIRLRNTGTPSELAAKLGISPRQWFRFKKVMEEACGCPIAYDTYAQTYYYTKNGRFFFGMDKIE